MTYPLWCSLTKDPIALWCHHICNRSRTFPHCTYISRTSWRDCFLTRPWNLIISCRLIPPSHISQASLSSVWWSSCSNTLYTLHNTLPLVIVPTPWLTPYFSIHNTLVRVLTPWHALYFHTNTLVICYLMSADSLYYIYYARDNKEPHFVFIDYSLTCLHLRHLLPASHFYHRKGW